MHLAITIILILCPLSSLTSEASPFSIGSRSLLREITDNTAGGSAHDAAAVDLNSTNFDAFLKGSSAPFAIIEFFAHWCPACRNYKPHYEKVARLFNGPDAAHPGVILMARVDCAVKINAKLCGRFSVSHFPMLLWGPPSKFVSGDFDPRKDPGIKNIDDGRTAERLLSWINKQMSSSFSLNDEKHAQVDRQSGSSDPGQVKIELAVHDIEEATATAFEIILEHKMINANTRASFMRFLQILVAHHPSRSCRKGGAEVLVNFDDLFPSNIWMDNQEKTLANGVAALGNFRICGKDVPRSYWVYCRGSMKETRGYSCGLWVLLHAISVRVDDGESNMAFTAICDFIHNFFICDECRKHFYKMCSSVSVPFNKTQDLALWLWTSHNKVNERLMKEEAALETGDPKYPKVIWPPEPLCPSCYLSSGQKNNQTSQGDWNLDEVFKFLANYYGKKLISLPKDKGLLKDDDLQDAPTEEVVTTNAVVVPIGAALAIAVASFAFGSLACLWRSRQKRRKYGHHLHSFKNI
ncbi:Sulfhydryl oxidase 1 [Dionaea muscipula]